jgi:hypothetical protein
MAQYQQTRSDLGPYRDAGTNALNQLQAIFGLGGGGQAPIAAAPAASSSSSSSGSLPNGWAFIPGSPAGEGENASGEMPGQIFDANGNLVMTLPATATQADAAALMGGVNAGQTPTATSAPVASSGSASNPLAAYGLSGLTFQPTQAQLEQTPGYQFDLAQGLQGVANSNAAQGRGISGAALKGAASYATGLANNTLTTQQGIFQQNLGNVINPLEWMANLGQNSAATTGQQGIAAVGNANNALIGGANASAAGQVGAANALAGGLSSLGGAPTNYLLYNQLLNNSGGYQDSGGFG